MKKFSALELPFDQYSRQLQVFELIERCRPKNKTFKILDVGGYKGATTKLQSNDEVTVLDVFDVDEPGYVKGDGLNLTFKDGAYDFVVCFDVFEHIPDKDRKKFIQEITRVAKIAAVVAAPVRTEQSQFAEQSLDNLYKELHGERHPWLSEHIDYGLPKVGQADSEMVGQGLHTVVMPSNNTMLWLSMQQAIFVASKYDVMSEAIKDLNRYYNEFGPFDGTVDADDSYRHIVAGFKDRALAKEISKWANSNRHELSGVESLKIQQKIAETFARGLAAQKASNDELSTQNYGYRHSSEVLGSQIHELQAKLEKHENKLYSVKKLSKETKAIGRTVKKTIKWATK